MGKGKKEEIKEVEKNNSNSSYVTLIVLLSLLLLVTSGYIVYDKVCSKNKVEEEQEVVNYNVQNEEETNKEITPVNVESNTQNESSDNQNRNVNYDYSNEEDFKKLNTLTINDIDISKYVSNDHNDLKIDKKDDFVIISYSSGGTCGFESFGLLVFDYNAKLLYQNKEYKNELDKLVYDGKYQYNDTDNTLTINYHLSCDLDCNLCEKLLYEDENHENVATCDTINKYRNVNSKEKYSVKYLGNGNFSSEELIESTKIVNDSNYSHKFNKC